MSSFDQAFEIYHILVDLVDFFFCFSDWTYILKHAKQELCHWDTGLDFWHD